MDILVISINNIHVKAYFEKENFVILNTKPYILTAQNRNYII